MKKSITITAMLFLLTGMLYAQKTSIGFHAGSTFSNQIWKYENESLTLDHIFGFQAGIVADLPLGNHISIQPGLNFLQKGANLKEEQSGITYEQIIRSSNIEIPLNFLYNTRGKSGNFFVGVGPAVSFALGGKFKEKVTNEEDFEEDISFGNDEQEDDLRGLDFGINALVGYQFKPGFFISANYNLGLRNLTPGGNADDGTMKSRYFGIRIGYMLNR